MGSPTLLQRLQAAWLSVPLGLRKFAVDAIEAGITAVMVLNIALPNLVNINVDDAKRLAITVGSAFLSGVISAVRRNGPAFLDWLAKSFPLTSLR